VQRGPGRHGLSGVGCVLAVAMGSCSRPPIHVARIDEARASDAVTPRSLRPTSSEFRVATFNAGLAVGVVKLASERVEPVAQAVPKMGVYLVCLQEVWLEEHWARIVHATSALLPHAVRLPPVATAKNPAGSSNAAACSAEEIAPLASCAKQSCPGLTSDELASCVLKRCRGIANRLSAECASCLATDPTGTADAILAPCVGSRTAMKGGGSPSHVVAFGGSYGLGMLTSETIVAEDTLRLETDLNPRAAMYVRLRTESIGEIDAFCTHLTPDVGELAPPAGRTWGDVHAAEVDALAKWIDIKANGARPIILLGDFNSGPPISATTTERFAADYAKFMSNGFINAYTLGPGALCTFCDANPLNEGAGSEGTIIDHILTKNFAGRVSVEPILRESIDLRVGSETVRAAYSDHYGLKATLRRAR